MIPGGIDLSSVDFSWLVSNADLHYAGIDQAHSVHHMQLCYLEVNKSPAVHISLRHVT